jgi:Nucleotidyltransferase domain
LQIAPPGQVVDPGFEMSAHDIARSIAHELIDQGALAVVLMGSHSRGDALPHSDIDVAVLGKGPEYRLARRNGHLVAISWTMPEEVKRAMYAPATAGIVVQGWRDGQPLIDPSGHAAELRRAALAWDWSVVGEAACDNYVAEELAGLAEEVHKLVNLLDSGNLRGAAVQRSILAFRIGMILAVHLRLLYATENVLWDLVANALDERWRVVQDAAFGLSDESFVETCSAALDLYRHATELIIPLMDKRQVAVVRAAAALGLGT